jgi:hypothetical protein
MRLSIERIRCRALGVTIGTGDEIFGDSEAAGQRLNPRWIESAGNMRR